MKRASEEIIRILMQRDGLSYMEAQATFREGMREVKKAIAYGGDPEIVFEQEFGLEPDYLFDVLA
jgi:hypothetical protein